MKKLNNRQKGHEYAVYRGDELIVIGTADECAEFMGVTRNYVIRLATPAVLKRVEKSKNPEKMMIGVKLN